MAKFNEYTQKATPEDADTLMIYDAAAKANKLSPFSGIWNWIVGKLTNAVISNLQTSRKTVVGAINELSSNSNFTELKFNSDLNSAIEMRFYHTSQSDVVNSLKNKPSSIQLGEMIIAWLPSSQDNLYGCQLLFHTESTSQNTYMRHKIENQWTAWQKFSLS